MCLQGADPTADEAKSILQKMEKVVELTEKELDLLVKNKGRIDELHVGGESPRPPAQRTEHASSSLPVVVAGSTRLTLGATGFVKKNLLKSQEAGVAFSNQLREKAPADLKDKASELEARRNKAFEKAVSVFANSQGGEDQDDAAEDSD